MQQFQQEKQEVAKSEPPPQSQPLEQPGEPKAELIKPIQGLGQFSYLEIVGMVAIAILVFNQFFAFSITVTRKPLLQKMLGSKADSQIAVPLLAEVLPQSGVELPVTWGDLGRQMVLSGVIDQQKFESIYAQQGGLSPDMKRMLLESGNGKIKITSENSGTILNLLWALGLGNKNEILAKGEMQDPRYGGAVKFASTGGWPLSTGNIMDHYSKHQFMGLTADQQALVDRVSQNIYRPCCGNSTHFPDCNHGMAMLGLLELMASQGVSEANIYKYALAVNSYWFPNNYLTIASYFKSKGTNWGQVNPQLALSAQYSSSQGYQGVLQQVQPQQIPQSKGGCGI